MKIFQFIVLSLFTSFTLTSCEQNATPKIYPAKKGVDSAYANLLKIKVEEKIRDDQDETETKPAKQVAKVQQQKKIEKAISNVDKIVPFSKDNTRDTLKITYAKAKQTVTKKAGQTNTFVFNSDTAKKVAIKLSAADTLANIRINHIKGPVDSIKGGPFGKTLIFDLPAKGNYNFSISEKPTDKKPYQGEYQVELQLLWK
ncbi:hypothetical protein [Faecalibacter bovis]|uniref:Lipoprotein n=1 Tax=Faecalibacter bovis TaxID=2898187 RepID=A0ABX7XF41_9FLAO|nr:hypothetical protein [Faecalibacter bovis]QTV06510.1 hypothetical protein J9309_04080 [Faecalibacter bovis]